MLHKIDSNVAAAVLGTDRAYAGDCSQSFVSTGTSRWLSDAPDHAESCSASYIAIQAAPLLAGKQAPPALASLHPANTSCAALNTFAAHSDWGLLPLPDLRTLLRTSDLQTVLCDSSESAIMCNNYVFAIVLTSCQHLRPLCLEIHSESGAGKPSSPLQMPWRHLC